MIADAATDANTHELDRREREMERRWLAYTRAESGTTSLAQFERLYDAYLDALDAYIAAKIAHRQRQTQRKVVPARVRESEVSE